MAVDPKTISGMRREFLLKNEQWCPDEKIRLNMFVEEHFVERLLQRFDPTNASYLIKSIWQWIDANYCYLLFDSRVQQEATKYRIILEQGTACFVLFNNTLRIRTCFPPNEPEE